MPCVSLPRHGHGETSVVWQHLRQHVHCQKRANSLKSSGTFAAGTLCKSTHQCCSFGAHLHFFMRMVEPMAAAYSYPPNATTGLSPHSDGIWYVPRFMTTSQGSFSCLDNSGKCPRMTTRNKLKRPEQT